MRNTARTPKAQDTPIVRRRTNACRRPIVPQMAPWKACLACMVAIVAGGNANRVPDLRIQLAALALLAIVAVVAVLGPR